MTKRAVYIGRYSPFHKGHFEIMKRKIEQGVPLLILVRDTHYDIYPPMLRKRMIEAAMHKIQADAKVIIVDDIESINYGRGVGYEVNEMEVPNNIENISATEIRSLIDKGDNSWREMIPMGADKVLKDYLSDNGLVVWMTGLPKSGKSTIAKLVMRKFEDHGIKAELLDSKSTRGTISKDLGFSKEERTKNLERAMEVAKILSKNGAMVICSFITPYKSQREQIRKELCKHGNYYEVYVKSSLENCKNRDTEGVYKAAEEGKIEHFTGVSDPYEEPEKPDLVLNSDDKSMAECAEELFKLLIPVI